MPHPRSRNTEHSHYIPKYERRRDKAANQAVRDRVSRRSRCWHNSNKTRDSPGRGEP